MCPRYGFQLRRVFYVYTWRPLCIRNGSLWRVHTHYSRPSAFSIRACLWLWKAISFNKCPRFSYSPSLPLPPPSGHPIRFVIFGGTRVCLPVIYICALPWESPRAPGDRVLRKPGLLTRWPRSCWPRVTQARRGPCPRVLLSCRALSILGWALCDHFKGCVTTPPPELLKGQSPAHTRAVRKNNPAPRPLVFTSRGRTLSGQPSCTKVRLLKNIFQWPPITTVCLNPFLWVLEEEKATPQHSWGDCPPLEPHNWRPGTWKWFQVWHVGNLQWIFIVVLETPEERSELWLYKSSEPQSFYQ